MVDFPEELCPVIAQLTDGFSFAYLKELFVIVLWTIARSKSDEKTAMEMGVAENINSIKRGWLLNRWSCHSGP